MPAPAKTTDESSTLVPRARLAFTRRGLHESPLAKDLAAPFDARLAEWMEISPIEYELVDTVDDCTDLYATCDGKRPPSEGLSSGLHMPPPPNSNSQ